ncbi:MAG: HAD-IB family phosphatase [bacterium]
MLRNVYDFDKTIFDGDSTQKFYIFLLTRHPQLLTCLPKQAFYFTLFSMGLITKTEFKEKFYSAFKLVPNIDKEVELFWIINIKNIKTWYYENHRDDDIVISASPEFLLEPICRQLNINCLLASRVNKKNGTYKGLNCYGEEKVIRLKQSYPNVRINEFYSDSFSDEPLAKLARKSYFVVKDELYLWWAYKKGNLQKK